MLRRKQMKVDRRVLFSKGDLEDVTEAIPVKNRRKGNSIYKVSKERKSLAVFWNWGEKKWFDQSILVKGIEWHELEGGVETTGRI